MNIIEVHKWSDKYYMFYTTAPNSEFFDGTEIGFAESDDGLKWEEGTLLISPGTSGSFYDWGTMAPTVVVSTNSTSSNITSITILFTAWQLQNTKCFPVPADGRFGSPLSKDRCALSNIGKATAKWPLIIVNPKKDSDENPGMLKDLVYIALAGGLLLFIVGGSYCCWREKKTVNDRPKEEYKNEMPLKVDMTDMD
jgi:hypothetical protein